MRFWLNVDEITNAAVTAVAIAAVIGEGRLNCIFPFGLQKFFRDPCVDMVPGQRLTDVPPAHGKIICINAGFGNCRGLPAGFLQEFTGPRPICLSVLRGLLSVWELQRVISMLLNS